MAGAPVTLQPSQRKSRMEKALVAIAEGGKTTAATDKERIRIGAGYRLPAVAPADVADQGKIRMGAGYRLPGRDTA
jgi:hypothetical protein